MKLHIEKELYKNEYQYLFEQSILLYTGRYKH